MLALVVMTFGLGVIGAPPAQAHFERGANCHIERVSANGTVTFRITNRLFDWAHIYCGLRFSDGAPGYYRIDVGPRRYVTRREHYNGFWDWVKIVHVHVTPF